MTLLRVLRVLRLVKLVRLFRASRLFERWKSKVTLSYGTQTVLQCLLILVLGSHWCACIIGLSAALHSSIDETWIGERLYNLCGDESDAVKLSQSGALSECPGLTVGQLYLASVSWSVLIITGCGGTDFYPSRASHSETVVVTVLVIMGSFIWTVVLALFVNIATNSNPALTAFRQHLDGLNLYIEMHTLPKEMAQRLRAYLHQQKGVQFRENAARALPLLSAPLQVEVALHVHSQWLDHVFFVRSLEPPVKVQLARAMETKVLAPGEVAPMRYLYVIYCGKIMFGSRCLSRGMCWGDDVILSSPTYFLPYRARAIAYSDVTQLSRDKILSIVANYPASSHLLRQSTRKLALRRAIVAFARQEKEEAFLARRYGTARSPNMTGKDFMDRVNEAAAKTMSKGQESSMVIAHELDRTSGTSTRTGGSSDGAVGDILREMQEMKAALDRKFDLLHAELKEVKEGQQRLKEQ